MILLNVNYSQLKRQFKSIRGYILLFGQKNIAHYISTQQQNKEIDNNNKCQEVYKSSKKYTNSNEQYRYRYC
jgi:hypothetical protein